MLLVKLREIRTPVRMGYFKASTEARAYVSPVDAT
jgi:hypothetical protein